MPPCRFLHELSADDKFWIGNEVASRRSTGRAMASRLGIRRKTVTCYTTKVKKHLKFSNSYGRPAKLDIQAMKSLIEEVRECGELSREEMVSRIARKSMKTLSRYHSIE